MHPLLFPGSHFTFSYDTGGGAAGFNTVLEAAGWPVNGGGGGVGGGGGFCVPAPATGEPMPTSMVGAPTAPMAFVVMPGGHQELVYCLARFQEAIPPRPQFHPRVGCRQSLFLPIDVSVVYLCHLQ